MFPKNRNWKGVYPGNIAGSIWQTRNVDIDTIPGRIRLADRMHVYYNEDDANLSTLTYPTKFLRSNADNTDRYWAVGGEVTLIAGGRLAKTDAGTPLGEWAIDSLANAPTDVLDIENHEFANGEQRLVATRATDIAILNRTGVANAWTASWWQGTLSQSALSTNAHPLVRLERLLIVGDGDRIHTIDKDDVVSASKLVFPGYAMRFGLVTANRVWIALRSERRTSVADDRARILEWDGTSLTYNREHFLTGSIPMTGWVIDGVPYVLTEKGFIFRYNGFSFEMVQQFPLVEEQLPFDSDLLVSPYGADVSGKKAYILVNDLSTGNNTSLSRRTRSGVWVYNSENNNLTHQMGLSSAKTGAASPDFGQSPLGVVGGIKVSDSAVGLLITAGARYYSAYTGTEKDAIYRFRRNRIRNNANGINRGYFITTHIPASDIEETWQAVFLRFKRFVDSGNRIVVKARTVDPLVPITAQSGTNELIVQSSGTWTATTTFTSVVPSGVAVGDEVEVMTGNGAGCLFHISTLSATPDGSATITVTVDEALPTLNADGSRGALFRFDNWTKVGTIDSQTIGHKRLTMPEPVQGEFVQFKVELRGYEVEIDDIFPIPKSKTSPKQG